MTTRSDSVDDIPADFWRSLTFFNFYRLALAGFVLSLTLVFNLTTLFGEFNGQLFQIAALCYTVVVVASFVPLRWPWPPFDWQLAAMVCCDIIALTVLAHASGGIQSSVGLLLMVSLAVAGIISRGKITLFFAALASIAALLEHAFAVLYDNAPVAQYIQVGLLCVAYFAVAGLVHKLAKYALENQRLAQRRGRDLLGMAEANRLVMRDMQDGVLVVDERGEIVQMNPSAARLLHQHEAVGGSLAECFPLLHEQYRLWRSNAAHERETQQLDGGLQARLRFVGIQRETAQGAVIFLEDMQQVMAEAQQIKLAALGRLTANMAHEVRNPLSAISYATELLQEESADATQRRLLQLIHDNTQRINRIVEDVMQLNRRDRAQIETFELVTMLTLFVEEFRQAERVDERIVVLQPADEVLVSFDRGHLRQVLWNLCRNGVRFGQYQPGSLLLLIGTEHGRVTLSVQDDGPGVGAEDLQRLFEPFFTTSDKGTGLGLYIAQELCEANDARLEYLPAATAGACFRILFGERRSDNGLGQEYGR